MDEKTAVYLAIFRRKHGIANATEEQIQGLLAKIESRNYVALCSTLWIGNKASREVFALETGIKLPKTATATNAAIAEYCGDNYRQYIAARQARIDAREAEKQKAKDEKDAILSRELDGFLDGKPNMQRQKALNSLANIRINNEFKKSESAMDAIRRWAAAGTLATHTYEVDRIKFPKNWNAMWQREQDEWQRRHDEAGKKTVYCVSTTTLNGSFYELGKTAYDYAQYLLSRKENVQ